MPQSLLGFRPGHLTSVLLLAGLAACGKSTPTTPSPTPVATVHASVTVTSMFVAGEIRSGGYAYRVVLHLKESAGAAATLSSVDLTFMGGSTLLVSSHHQQPISEANNVCPPGGTIDTRELLTADTDGSHVYATTVQAKVSYTDGTMVAWRTHRRTCLHSVCHRLPRHRRPIR